MQTERVIGYDIIRIIAATMVVAIHSNVYFLAPHDGSLNWMLTMFFTALCAVAVPLFFMVSGAGNLVKDNLTSFKTLFKIKIPKVFIPFILWSLIYVALRMYSGKIAWNADGFISLAWEPAYYQFWFMYTLFGLYLMIPIFQFIINKASKRVLQYIIAFWVVSAILIPLALRYIPGFKLSSHFDLLFLEGYWGYFFIGGYLRKYPPTQSMKKSIVLAAVGFFVTCICALIEWHYTPQDKYYGYVYCAYLLPAMALTSIEVFIILQRMKVATRYRKTIIALSGLTMGVFYIHTLIINIYEEAFKNVDHTFFNAMIKLVACVLVSVAICFVIKQIPLAKKYLL